MRRGDLYWVDLDPALGSEAAKLRPALVVSGDAANRAAERTGRGVITVAPVTSDVRRVYPFQVRLPKGEAALRTESKVQCEQVRSIAVQRLRDRIGGLPGDLMAEVDRAVRLHLAL